MPIVSDNDNDRCLPWFNGLVISVFKICIEFAFGNENKETAKRRTREMEIILVFMKLFSF